MFPMDWNHMQREYLKLNSVAKGNIFIPLIELLISSADDWNWVTSGEKQRLDELLLNEISISYYQVQ